MDGPWNDWFHCNGNTYGTWLRGDPRGYRERHHRLHVEGDYLDPPPPGEYEALHRQSKRLMKGEAVHLVPRQRVRVCQALATKLLDDGIEALVVAVDDHHFHLLGRFPDHNPRRWVGRAKKHSSHIMRGDKPHASLWAVRFRALPVRDRAHQVNVFNYIERHRERGAAVWTFREPNPGMRD